MSLMLLGILNSQVSGGGLTPAYDFLEAVTVSTSVSSISFSNLNNYSSYKHLQLRISSQVTDYGGSDNPFILLTFNGDSASNYSDHRMGYESGGGRSDFGTSRTSIRAGRNVALFGSQHNGKYASSVIDILDFNSSSKNTTIRSLSGAEALQDDDVMLFSGAWMNTSSVSSLLLTPSAGLFRTATRVGMYGLKG